MKTNYLFVVVLLFSSLIAGCNGVDRPLSNKEIQTKKAEEAAASLSFTDNAEIDNIKRRLDLTGNPGLVGYVILLNEMGQPVFYTGVKGKVSSGSKRLTQPYRRYTDTYGSDIAAAPSDEGTWGSSNEYIFFWTTNDQYIQWNGKYLYSDKPFRLTQEPLAVSMPSK